MLLPTLKPNLAMSLNWKEIDKILSEIPLEESLIQKIKQPDFTSLVIDLFNKTDRFPLYICLAQNQTRLHRLTRKVENTVQLQRFAQILRSRIKGARITAAYQVHGDRIIKLHLSRGDVESVLWIRFWSNAANIILTEPDGLILDAFYRRPKRGEKSGGNFNPESQPDIGKKLTSSKTYEVRHLPGEGDFNQRVEAYYFDSHESRKLEQFGEQLQKGIEREEGRLLAALEKAQRHNSNGDRVADLRRIGDLLMSNLHLMTSGAKWVELENFYDENSIINIELDPALAPEKNAEKYYQKAKKQQKRAELSSQEIASLERELADLHRIRDAASEETDPAVLQELLRALNAGGKQEARDKGITTPGLRFHSGPFTILLGRTSRENDELLRHHVRGNDYWLHARDYPGSYVFIQSIRGKTVPLEVLMDAGTLALHYSKAKSGIRGDLYYTQVKHLKRPKGGKQGLVLPTQEKNLTVTIEASRLNKLLGKSL
ncbi:MAG: fibronectin-binding domain-containing protein [Spirochaetales bacterium]|jgi:predicted ribosome quality control (RQC) complex YloA/Tae2 family protein|nr:fibronectin-binding domain-containing protein [Spirochaetales bacterium]